MTLSITLNCRNERIEIVLVISALTIQNEIVLVINKLVFLVHFLLISIGFINEVVLLLFFSFIKKEEKRISHKRGCTFQAKFLILN